MTIADMKIAPMILVSNVGIPAISFTPVKFSTPFDKSTPNVFGQRVKIALIKLLNTK